MTEQIKNTSTPRHWAEVIKAWADGKMIQFKVGNVWATYNPTKHAAGPWNCGSAYQWRIKPEAKTGQINIYPPNEYSADKECCSTIHTNKELANFSANMFTDQEEIERIACIQITYTEGEGL